MEETHSRRPVIATELALLLLLATLWGASYTFIKLGVATIPPITLIAARTSIAGVVRVAVRGWRGVRLPRDAASWRRFLFQACLNSVIPWTLIAWGERSLDAGLATILNSAAPIFTFLLTFAVTGHEPATGRKLFGVLAGMTGICLIVALRARGGLGEQLAAEIAIVAATICYAGAAIFGRGFKGLDPIAPAAGSLLCGAAILVPVSLVVDRPWAPQPPMISTAGSVRAPGPLDRVRLRDLFPADPDIGVDRHNGTGLLAGADRRRARRSVSRREPISDGMDRPGLCGDWRGRNDDAGAEGCGD